MKNKKIKKRLPQPDQEQIIGDDLPEFFNERVLLVATGNQDAKFYLAHDGQLKAVDSFLIAKPRYSDREGHFKTRGAGKTIRSGAVYENRKQEVRSAFTHEFAKRYKQIEKKHALDKVYLFTPAHIRTHIRTSLPKAQRTKITMVIAGNHYKTHPLRLLKLIKAKSESKRVKLVSPEERKILKRKVNHKTVPYISKRAF